MITEPGLYWILSDGALTVAEREDGDNDWSMIGSDEPFCEKDGNLVDHKGRVMGAIREKVTDPRTARTEAGEAQ